jgi:hypothetical protein
MPDNYQSLMVLAAELGAENQRSRAPALESAMIELRRRAADAIRQISATDMCFDRAPPDHHFAGQRGLPEISGDQLTVETLSEGVLKHAALIVRGFFDEHTVAKLVSQLREEQQGQDDSSTTSRPEYGCAPASMCRLIDAYEESGFLRCVRQYFGEPPLMHAERAKLRRRIRGRDNYAVIPWHQDVNFFKHKTYALNVWCALNPVGEDNPGLAIVPRRTEDRLAWSGKGAAPLDYGNSFDSAVLESFTAEHPVEYPVLAPGDAVIFDEMTLHATASRPWQVPEQLVAITWFFRASRFPDNGTAIAV